MRESVVPVDYAGKSGTFVVPGGVGREYVLKADIRSKNRLDDEEAINCGLTVSR